MSAFEPRLEHERQPDAGASAKLMSFQHLAEALRGEKLAWGQFDRARVKELVAMRQVLDCIKFVTFACACLAMLGFVGWYEVRLIGSASFSFTGVLLLAGGICLAIALLLVSRALELFRETEMGVFIMGGTLFGALTVGLLGTSFVSGQSDEIIPIAIGYGLPIMIKLYWSFSMKSVLLAGAMEPNGNCAARETAKLDSNDSYLSWYAESLPWFVRWLCVAAESPEKVIRAAAAVVLVEFSFWAAIVCQAVETLLDRLSGAPPPLPCCGISHETRCERNLSQPWAGRRIFYALLPRGVHASAC